MIWNARRWSSSCSSYKMSQGEESTLQTRCSTKISPILMIIIIIINIVDIGIQIFMDQNIWKYRRTERSRVARSSLSFSSATSLSGWALKTQQCSLFWKYPTTRSELCTYFFQTISLPPPGDLHVWGAESGRVASSGEIVDRVPTIWIWKKSLPKASQLGNQTSEIVAFATPILPIGCRTLAVFKGHLSTSNWHLSTFIWHMSTFNWHLSTFNWHLSTCSRNLSTCNEEW